MRLCATSASSWLECARSRRRTAEHDEADFSETDETVLVLRTRPVLAVPSRGTQHRDPNTPHAE